MSTVTAPRTVRASAPDRRSRRNRTARQALAAAASEWQRTAAGHAAARAYVSPAPFAPSARDHVGARRVAAWRTATLPARQLSLI